MPWNDVRRKAGDDVTLTDAQRRVIIGLQERIDRVPEGTYASNTYALTSREASLYIDELRAKLDARRIG